MPRRKLERSASEVDIPRLCQQIYRSRLVLRPWRENRKLATELYTGARWSNDAALTDQPVNLLALYVQVVSRQLVARDPRVQLGTLSSPDRPAVSAMESWVNLQIVRQKIGTALRRIVVDGLFSIGIAKVALATPGDAAMAGWGVEAGMPYLDSVDLDDFAFDPHCRDFSEAAWVACRYRQPLEVVRDARYYGSARNKLEAQPWRFYDETGSPKITNLTGGTLSGTEDMEDMVDLWEVWLPRHNMILTLPATNDQGEIGNDPLRAQPWLGHPCGPYHYLGYGTVPGNPMPLSPLQNLVDLHEANNLMYNKLIQQTLRQKTITAYDKGNDADAERVRQSNDGEMVGITRADSVREVRFGGPDAQAYQMMLDVNKQFGFQAGNLPAMMGVPQARTASQDELAAQGANATLGDLQSTTVDFIASTLKAMCWYWWEHPELVAKSRYEAPGTGGVGIDRMVYPRGRRTPNGETPILRRDSAFDGLDLKVDPYSILHVTPAQKGGALRNFFTNVLLPMLPMLQQQGIVLDVNKFLQQQAKFFDSPEMLDWMNVQDPVPATGGPAAPGMSPNTSRTYNRVSSSAQSAEGEMGEAAEAMSAAETSSGRGQ